MIGDELGADMHVIGCDAAAARNLMLGDRTLPPHRSTPSWRPPTRRACRALVDDEAELGVGADRHGRRHDLDRRLRRAATSPMSTPSRSAATTSRWTSRAGSPRKSQPTPSASRRSTAPRSPPPRTTARRSRSPMWATTPTSRHASCPKSQLVRIIRPRVEEILELVRDRLKDAGFCEPRRTALGADGRRQRSSPASPRPRGGSCPRK